MQGSRLGLAAAGRRWLVDLTEAGEIVPVPASMAVVPLTQDWFRGLVNLRGTLYGVVDLARFLGGSPLAPTRDSRLLVFGASLHLNSSILVSQTLGLRDCARWTPDTGAAGNEAAWIGRGLRDAEGGLWHELSLRGLAADERFLMVGR